MNMNKTDESSFVPASELLAESASTPSNGTPPNGNLPHDAPFGLPENGRPMGGQPVLGEGIFHAGGSRFADARPHDFDAGIAAPFAATEEKEENLDWRSIFAMFRRRRKIMAAVFFSVVALGLLMTYLTRPIYRANATLLFSDSPASAGGLGDATDQMPFMANMMVGTKTRSRATQIAILQGSQTINGAMNRLSLKEQKVLGQYLTVSADQFGETDLITVAVQGYDAQASSDLANAICNQFIAQNKNRSREQITAATEYLKNRLVRVRGDLDSKRQALKNFQLANNTIDPTEEAAAHIADYGAIQASLRQVEAERAGNNAQLSSLRSQISQMKPILVQPNGIVRRPAVEELKRSMTRLELQRVQMAQEYTPESDEMRQVDGQIAQIKSRLKQEAQTEIGSWNTSPNPLRQESEKQATEVQSEVWAQEARAKALNAAAQQAQAQIKKLPQQQYQVSQLAMDLKTLEATYQILNQKYITMRLQEQTSASTAQVQQTASPDNTPVSPKKKTNFILSVMIGLVLATAAAALVDHLDDRVHSQQEAEMASGLPILASIPFIGDKSKQTLLETGEHSSVLLESYRLLRTNIEFASLGKSLRSIALTSTQPNEGKSTTCTDLAIVMAMDGRKVILLDVDLRRPTLHTFFGLPNRIGFTNLVAGTATLEDALQATAIPNLFLLTSGPIPPNPPELLNSKAARAVMAKLDEESDLLIVDTPPALVMADAQIVASMTDAALLIVSMQEAGKREIARTSQALAQTGTHVLGAVLNKASEDSHGYYSNYQKQYYGNYIQD